jgi:hypothetical protein
LKDAVQPALALLLMSIVFVVHCDLIRLQLLVPPLSGAAFLLASFWFSQSLGGPGGITTRSLCGAQCALGVAPSELHQSKARRRVLIELPSVGR